MNNCGNAKYRLTAADLPEALKSFLPDEAYTYDKMENRKTSKTAVTSTSQPGSRKPGIFTTTTTTSTHSH